MDFEKRDRIIFDSPYLEDEYDGGVRYFDNLRCDKFRELMRAGMFNPYLQIKYCEYWWFMEKFDDDDKLYLHGFVYARDRGGEIVIQGIGRDEEFEYEEPEKIFRYLFEDADQFELDPPRAWYD